jgi:SAM-dependent methyltransferase
MSRSLPLPVQLCLFYNRLFAGRTRRENFLKEVTEADLRRRRDTTSEDLRYAELEHAKAELFMRKFPALSLRQQRVLDFGCRFGGASLWYAEQGAAHVIGIDIAPRLLAIAEEYLRRKRGQSALPPVEFRLSLANAVPVEDRSIDLILSEDVVEHLSDPEATFREWQRVLAPGGRVVLSFGPLWYHPHGLHLWEIFPGVWNHVIFSEQTWMMARNVLKADGGQERRCTDLNKMTLRRFERLVRQSGFRVPFLRTHAVWRMQPLLKLPVVRELFASQVDCILERPA